MILYDSSNNDHMFALVNWWKHLVHTKELDLIFMPDMHSVNRFFIEFAPPTQLWFDFDDEGLTVVIWMRPFIGSVIQGFWVREDKRKSPSIFKHWIMILNAYFQTYNTILGITKRPEILEEHTKMGYDIGAGIPNLFGDKMGWIVYLNKHKFKYLKEEKNDESTATEATVTGATGEHEEAP